MNRCLLKKVTPNNCRLVFRHLTGYNINDQDLTIIVNVFVRIDEENKDLY